MIDFSSFLNLPLIFGYIMGFAIFMYVILDGFDLGVGILFPFAPTQKCRDQMMHSIAPFWDGNETWLVLGGMVLFAAFPPAYSIILPALYIPIIIMLIGLIFRGVAFELRHKAKTKNELRIWDYSFHFGSLVTAFFQGVILGAFIQGFRVNGWFFTGYAWDWLTAFSLTSGVAVVFSYMLLGSVWTIMKTGRKTRFWARSAALYSLAFVVFFIILATFWTPFVNRDLAIRWFLFNDFFYLMQIPVFIGIVVFFLVNSLIAKRRSSIPFLLTIVLFTLGYVGIGLSVFPYVVPYQLTFALAAAAPTSLSFLLVGIAVILPVILGYTAFSYYVFRGKVSEK